MAVLDYYTYDAGLSSLKTAFSKTKGYLKEPQFFLYIVHAFYAGWLEDTGIRKAILDKAFSVYDSDGISWATAPLRNLSSFIKSERSDSVSFLRPALKLIVDSYKNDRQAFEDLYSALRYIPVQWFDEYWEKAFDELLSTIEESSGKDSSEFTQPNELTQLVNVLVGLLQPESNNTDSTRYDPFAGVGGFLTPSSNSFAQELRQDVYALSRLRTLALGYDPAVSSNYVCDDSILRWSSNPLGVSLFDTVVSFPPMGIRVPHTKEMKISWPLSKIKVEDYFIIKGADSLNPDGVLFGVLSPSFLFADGPTGVLREDLVKSKRVKMVIQLPDNLLYYSGISLCIVVLTHNSRPNEETLFFDASSFYTKSKRKNVLLDTEIIKLLVYYLQSDKQATDSEAAKFIISVDNEEIVDNHCSLVPSNYLSVRNELSIQVPDGFEERTLRDIVSIYKGKPMVSKHARVVRGRDLPATGPMEYSTFEFLQPEQLSGRAYSIDKDAILVQKIRNLKPTLFKAFDGIDVSLSQNVAALVPVEGVDPYYLASELRKPYVSEQVESLSQGAIMPFLRNEALLSIRVILPVERSLQHATFLSNQRIEEEQRLKSLKIDEFIRAERDRLSQMMSIRRHRIAPHISGLKDNVAMLLEKFYSEGKVSLSTLLGQGYSVQDALENMESNLSQLKELVDAFTVDASVGIAETIELPDFIEEYSFTPKIPGRTFTLEKSLPNGEDKFPRINFNKSNLVEILDEIIHNAEKHFAPDVHNCKVMLIPTCNGKTVKLLVCNNGDPVPSDFDEERSFVAGYHKDPNGTGQGLFRVRQICDEFGAHIEWVNDPESLMSTGLLITFKTSDD